MSYLSISFWSLMILPLLSGACCEKNQPISSDVHDGDITEIASHTLGGEATLIYNDNGLYVLCTYKDDPIVHFIVMNSQGDIVLERESTRGTVKWHSESSLVVTYMPGIINDQVSEKEKRIINLEKKYER